MKIEIDTSSFDFLIELYSEMKKGQEITAEKWGELLNTMGYQALLNEEFSENFFKRNLELAFNPTKSEELRNALEVTTESRYLRYYIEVREKMADYQNHVKTLQKNWARLEDAIITRAQSLLPYKEFDEEITVSIAVFDRDARAYEAIILDPIFTTQMESFVSIVAHEVHHILRHGLLKYDKDKVEDEEKDIVWVLEQMQAEGIADHIDKGYFIYGKEQDFFHKQYVTMFKQYVSEVPKIMKDLDEIFLKLSQGVYQKEVAGKELRNKIPLSCHPLGYYMANIIIKNSLLDDMIRDIGNPFSFVKLYNKAVLADRKEMPSFALETIEQIDKLEQKYVKK